VPKGQEFTYAVRAQGRLETEEEFGRIVVRASPDGSILRLKDVARSNWRADVQPERPPQRQAGALVALYQMPAPTPSRPSKARGS